MRDTDLYRQVFGLDKPWTVECVDLYVAGQGDESCLQKRARVHIR